MTIVDKLRQTETNLRQRETELAKNGDKGRHGRQKGGILTNKVMMINKANI
jgi:hypothetical protein